MGVNVSCAENKPEVMDSSTLKKRNKEIDDELLRDQRTNAKIIKLLLLGTAECGKSTILKQMKILHSAGFNDTEVQLQKCCIFENIITAMAAMIEAMPSEALSFSDRNLQIDAQMITKLQKSGKDRFTILSADITQVIKRLWRDENLQKMFTKAETYHIPVSVKFFLDDVDRISSSAYIPTQHDILLLRVATTGINEIEFTMKNTKYRVFDVGGQRSERRKWIHCFDNVNAIIYVAALSDYNIMLAEDNHTNRIHESIKLFETICNSKWFKTTPTLLFLNKRDLFQEKIGSANPLRITFPEYQGIDAYEPACAYIKEQYVKTNQQLKREIYVHKTCATDTKGMQFIFDACFDIISQLSMENIGVM